MNVSKVLSRQAALAALFSVTAILIGGFFISQAQAGVSFNVKAPTLNVFWHGEQTIKWNYPTSTSTANVKFSLAYSTSTSFSSNQYNIASDITPTNTNGVLSYIWQTGNLASGSQYRVRIYDSSNSAANTVTSEIFNIDNIAPATNLGVSSTPGGNNGWYKGTTEPTITLTCADNLSGCSSINYAWYNATSSAVVTASTTVSTTPSGTPISLTGTVTPPQGDNVLVYYSEDNAVDKDIKHNVEDAQRAEFKVDTIAPIAPVISLPAYINSANETAVAITGTGNEAGDTVNYTLTDSASTQITGTETVDSSGNISFSKDLSSFVDGTVTLTATLTDIAGNTGSSTTSTSVKDTVAQISSITSDATTAATLKIGDTIVFTMTPSTTEAGATVTGSYNGKTLSWSTIDSGLTYTATYTVVAGETDQPSALQISGVTYTDAAGNVSPAAAGTDITDIIDANSPTLSSVSISSNNANSQTLATISDIVTLLFTSSEAVGIPVVTIDTKSASVTSVTATNTWVATYQMVSGDAQGIVPFTIDYTDTAGNVGAQVTSVSNGSSVTYDQTPPIAPVITQIGVTSNNYINSGNENAVTVTGTAEAGSTVSVTLTDGTNTTVLATAVTDTSNNYSVTGINASSLTDGTVTATVNATDAAGNTGPDAIGTVTTATKDVAAPTVTSITTKDANNDGKIDTATVVFNEPVKDSTFTANDFTIDGVAATGIITGTANDNTIDVTLNSTDEVAGTNAKTVAYTGTTATDLAGNALATFSQLSIDGAGPVPMSAQTITTTEINVMFSEDLNGPSVTPADFSVFGNTVTGKSEVNGVVTLTLGTTIGTGDTPNVEVKGNGTTYGVQDLSGNYGPSSNANVMPTDGVAPVLSNVSISSNNADTTLAKAGDTVTLNFISSEALNTTTIPTVTIDGQTATVSNTSGNIWTATYVMLPGDTQGNIPFIIDYTDLSNNAGTQVTSTDTSNPTAVLYDSTVPTVSAGTDKDVHMSTVQNGTVADDAPSSGIASIKWSQTNGPAGGTVTFSSDTTAVTTISANVEGTYALKLTAIDTAGNVKTDTMQFIWDKTNPYVVNSVPVDGALNVPKTDGNATVVFSEPVKNLNISKVSLVNNSTTGTPVIVGAITVSGNTITIPYTGLTAGTMYRINVVSGAVKDNAGNNFTGNLILYFTTKATSVPAVIPTLVLAGNAIISPYTVDQAVSRFTSGLQFTITNAASTTVNGTDINVPTNGNGIITIVPKVDATTTGLHLYTVVVTSSTGNTVIKTVGYIVNANTIVPVIPTIALNGGAVANQYTQSGANTRFANGLQFNVTNADSYTVTVNSLTSPATSVSTLTTTTITATSTAAASTLGLHSYIVTVKSSTLNTAYKTVTYNVNSDPVITAPVITNIQAASVNATTTVITWTTDKSATSQVEYGTGTNYYGLQSAIDSTLTKSHSVTLAALVPSAVYNFRVVSIADSKTTKSSGNTFATGVDDNSVTSVSVTSIDHIRTYAAADDTYGNGWSWKYHITVPTSKNQLRMKFSDFVGSQDTITAGGNLRFYSAQSFDANSTTTAKTISASGTYSDAMTIDANKDLDPIKPGRQIDVIVEMKVPAGSVGGSYSAQYRVMSLNTPLSSN